MQLCCSQAGEVLVLDRYALAYNSTTIMAFESGLSSTDMRRMEQLTYTRTHELASLQGIVYPVFLPDPNYCPVLQIYSVSGIRNADTGIQHRLFVSDGYHIQRAVLARELNPMVESKQLGINLVQLLIKILDMEVQIDNFDPIGRPLDFLTPTGKIAIGWNSQDWDDRNRKWLDPEDVDCDDLDFEWEMVG